MSESTVSVAMRLLLERDAVASGRTTETHLVVELVPHGEGIESARAPLSVVFVLDVSGSMNGPPLEHVQGSVEALLDLLDPDDRVGVVAFADDAAETAALQQLDGAWKNVVKGRVRRLAAGGSTNMAAGLDKARELLGKRKEHERQLIVLLSDGQPNQGIATAEGLAAIAASMRPDVVTVTLGYGHSHGEDVLARIAEAGSGEYFYVANPLEADDAFARAVGAQGDVVADAVELAFRPGRGVEIGEFLGPFRPRFGATGLVIDHPDLLAHRPRYVVVLLRVTAPAEPGPWPVLAVEVGYRVAGVADRRSETREIEIPIKAVEGGLVADACTRVLLAQAEKARAEARAQADRGHFDGAAAIIRKLIEVIEKAPGFRPGDGSVLADALEQLIDERVAYERRPAAEEYRRFKRMNMGVDMQDGGWHHRDRALSTPKAQRIASGTQGNLPRAYIVVEGRDGASWRVNLAGNASIGRVQGNDIVLPIGSVSKRHTRIVGRHGKYMVVDLQSTNGTYFQGKRLEEPRILQPGDKLHIGDYALRYEEDPAADASSPDRKPGDGS